MVRRSLLTIFAVLGIGLAKGWTTTCVGPLPTGQRVLKKYKYTVIFVGTALRSDEGSGLTRFQVTEKFQVPEEFGLKLAPFVDVYPFPAAHFHFETGKQYLVFAGHCPWGGDNSCLASHTQCSSTRSLEHARAFVQQLRADRDGKPMASVYGMLILQERQGAFQPLPNIVVRLHNGKKSFEARTDEQGAYAFEQLPRGTYRVSADLPPNMEIAEYLGMPAEPFDLPSRSSFEHDIYAFPTGRIAGTVIGQDGRPVRRASVSLYRADQHREGEPGLNGYEEPPVLNRNDGETFAFVHLPAGDYLLVFNYADFVKRDAPFHRTYYPQSSQVENAQIIHLADGQQFTNADIHVGNPAAVREITVRIAWSSREPTAWVPVGFVAQGPGTRTWLADPQGAPFTYTLALWQGLQYSIQATTPCHIRGVNEAKTNSVAVDGGDSSVSEITLTFDKDWCSEK